MKKLILVIAVLFSLVSASAGAEESAIVVITDSRIAPYNTALEGFERTIQQNWVLKKYEITDIKNNAKRSVKDIKNDNPDAIFTIGTDSSLFAKNYFNGYPIVFSMVLYPKKNGIKGDNIAGVSLDIKIEDQFRIIKKIAPEAKTIGMLYDGNKMAWLKDEAFLAAKKLGLNIESEPVYSDADVVRALDTVIRRSDFLWAGVDTLVYNKHSAEHILLTTLRSKTPFMVFSSHYVRAGALVAMECDYYNIGEQSADIVEEVLKGKKTQAIQTVLPDKISLVINERTAKTIGIDLPLELLEKDNKVIVY